MSFDPENVERLSLGYNDQDVAGMDDDPNGDFVRFSDYDALLALYRTQLKLHEQVCDAQGI